MHRVVKKLARVVLARVFVFFDRLGVHILPKHYYSSVPDHVWLAEHHDLWQPPARLVGIRWDLDDQLEWLDGICSEHYREVERLELYGKLASQRFGPGYGPMESQVLHCLIRSRCPRRVVEVGGGISTAMMAHAAEMNELEHRPRSQIVTIEPFPSQLLRQLAGVQLIQDFCQAAPRAVFDELTAGDLLFIDSTHAVKAGSDVLRLYLEVVPALRAGVFVHVHDITLPYLYQRDVLTNFFDWQETSLVCALLTNNDRLEVLCCLSALHHERPAELAGILRDYRPQRNRAGLREGSESEGHFPSSLWLVTA